MRKQSKGLAVNISIKLLLDFFVVSGLVLATCSVSQAQHPLLRRDPDALLEQSLNPPEESPEAPAEAPPEARPEAPPQAPAEAPPQAPAGAPAEAPPGGNEPMAPQGRTETGGAQPANPDNLDPDLMSQFRNNIAAAIANDCEDAKNDVGVSYDKALKKGEKDYNKALKDLGLADKAKLSKDEKKAKNILDKADEQYKKEVKGVYDHHISELDMLREGFKQIRTAEWGSEMSDKEFVRSQSGYLKQVEKKVREIRGEWPECSHPALYTFQQRISETKKQFANKDNKKKAAIRDKSTKGKNGKFDRGNRQEIKRMRDRLEKGSPSGPSGAGDGGGGGGGGDGC